MKNRIRSQLSAAGLTVLLLALALSAAPAQDCAIDWFTVDGGGGVTSDGLYEVIGTIGQHDAGSIGVGDCVIEGGYWGDSETVQLPGSPWLAIERTGTNAVVLSWPAPAPGWVLQEGWSVPGGPWFTIIPPLAQGAGRLCAVLPKAAGYRFYRLKYIGGAPVLSVQSTGTNTLITWPAPAPGWGLEQRSPSALGLWTLPDAPRLQVGNQMQMVLPASASGDFYRLTMAPVLTITRGPTNTIAVSWLASAFGWVLEECPTLSSHIWSTVATAPVQAGPEMRVTLPGAGRGRFFRLAQASPAPRLSLTRSNGTLIISWPLPATGWLLHTTTNLVKGGGVWTEIPPPYQVNGPNLQVTEPSPVRTRFYRLHTP